MPLLPQLKRLNRGYPAGAPNSGAVLFLSLNRYAILLAVFSLVLFSTAFIAAFRIRDNAYSIAGSFICASFYAGSQSLKIFSAYPQKARAWYLLCLRNRGCVREESFGKYLESPCGRIVAVEAMRSVGVKDPWSTIRDLRNRRRLMAERGRSSSGFFG